VTCHTYNPLAVSPSGSNRSISFFFFSFSSIDWMKISNPFLFLIINIYSCAKFQGLGGAMRSLQVGGEIALRVLNNYFSFNPVIYLFIFNKFSTHSIKNHSISWDQNIYRGNKFSNYNIIDIFGKEFLPSR
jgi:hypothetical protein